MTDPVPATVKDAFHAALVARITALSKGALTLTCVRMADGHIELPRGANLTLSFTLAELRALGLTVNIVDADGKPMTDAAYVEAILAADRAAAEGPAANVTPLAAP
jgi:hypothetical protein